MKSKFILFVGLIVSLAVNAQIKIGPNPTKIVSGALFQVDGDNTVVNPSTLMANASGKVGVGTGSPSAQLHTTGTIRLENYPNAVLATDSEGNLIAIENVKYRGSGRIKFGDIFPNTGSVMENDTGNVASATAVTTTLGVVKATRITFKTPMPDLKYRITLTAGTTNTNPSENEFSKIGGVVYYYSNKTVNSFVIIAQELNPDTQEAAVEFSFSY